MEKMHKAAKVGDKSYSVYLDNGKIALFLFLPNADYINMGYLGTMADFAEFDLDYPETWFDIAYDHIRERSNG